MCLVEPRLVREGGCVGGSPYRVEDVTIPDEADLIEAYSEPVILAIFLRIEGRKECKGWNPSSTLEAITRFPHSTCSWGQFSTKRVGEHCAGLVCPYIIPDPRELCSR